ncbi:hypothetical protein FDZ71_02100 [bacterium]|nr:MAG: hypothetical protein FDZ71_02100 [bacterium]
MCQSYIRACACGQHEAEMMFGNMVLDEAAVRGLYCPECSGTVDYRRESMVLDNGWVLELDEDIIKAFAPRMRMEYDEVSAEKVFDGGYVSWVGMTPEDNRTRAKERQILLEKFADDKREQFEALKRWAIAREKQFVAQGWRKAVKK